MKPAEASAATVKTARAALRQLHSHRAKLCLCLSTLGVQCLSLSGRWLTSQAQIHLTSNRSSLNGKRNYRLTVIGPHFMTPSEVRNVNVFTQGPWSAKLLYYSL